MVETRFGRIGCGICPDRWCRETALAHRGAELRVFPSTIGSEPAYPGRDDAAHWRRTMQGQAAANLIPLVASNRIGTETSGDVSMTFYGTSFIAGTTGEILVEALRETESVITATVDLDGAARFRDSWGGVRRLARGKDRDPRAEAAHGFA